MSLGEITSPSTDPWLTVDRVDDGDGTRLTCRGELDLASAVVLQDAVRDLLTQAPRISIDVRALDFVDCAGLHGLEEATALAVGAGLDIEVLYVGGPVAQLLALTRQPPRFARAV